MDGRMMTTGVRTIPTGLPFGRAWRWCVLSTIRDLRRSAARRRTMSLPNTRRLFLRRFHDVCNACGISEDSTLRSGHAVLGATFLADSYRAQVELAAFRAPQQ
jgi:hypothetical protein